MTRVIWGTAGGRFYETGADRGVLYVGSTPGVAWDGLISVSEAPSGGDPQPYYLDGYKYINIAAAEEFEASLTAFSSPFEFGVCDGIRRLHNGLFITQQPRASFGLSYRTLVGNEIEGTDHAYKLHLVYNALAKPSGRSNNTISDSPDPTQLSWDISSRPPLATGYRPTAHLVVDSREADPAVLAELEDLLYGVEFVNPRLPTQAEIISLFAG